jgi:hypothetical protein
MQKRKPLTYAFGLILLAGTVACTAGAASDPAQRQHPSTRHPIEQAAPYEIPGVEIESHDHVPPMIDTRGNLYRVTEDDEAHGNRPQVMKSTDGGVTWVEQDPLHRPSSGDTEGGWALQDGPTIWFVWESNDVRLLRFNTSDHPTAPDTYQFQNEVAAPSTDPGHDQYASLAENADGSLWVAYGGGTLGAPHSSVVRRDPQGTYSSRETIDPAAATSAPRLVKGTGDRTYVFYKTADNRIYFRALSANGTLSAPVRVDSGGTNAIPTPLTNVVSYADGGDEVLVVLFAGPDGILRSVDVRNGVPGPEQVVSSTPVTLNPGVTTNDAAVAHLAVVGTTVVAMWSDAANGDVYSDQRLDGGQWGRDTLRVDTGTGTASDVQYVYLNVLRRSGDRATVGYTYDVGPTVDDDSNIFFAQFTVTGLPTTPGSGPGGPSGITLTAVDPPKGLVPRRSTPLRLRVRDADGQPLDGRTLGVRVRDTVTGDHRQRQQTSAGDRTTLLVRGYRHPTRVTVSDAATGAKGLVLDFLVKPRVSATGTRTAPGRYAVHGQIHPAVASRVTLQRRTERGWVRVERHTSDPSGQVTFTGERPGTYRLSVPAAGDRVAAQSHRLHLGRAGRG